MNMCAWVWGTLGEQALNTDLSYFQERAIVDVNTEALADQGRSIYFCLTIQGRLLGEVTPLINLGA